MEYTVEWSTLFKFSQILHPSFTQFNEPGVYVHLIEIRGRKQISYVGSSWTSVLERQRKHLIGYQGLRYTIYDLDRIGKHFETLYECMMNNVINESIGKGLIVLGRTDGVAKDPELIPMMRSNVDNLLFSFGRIEKLLDPRADVETVESLLQKYLITTYNIGQYPDKNKKYSRNRNLLGGIPKSSDEGHTLRSVFIKPDEWQRGMFGKDDSIQDSAIEIYH